MNLEELARLLNNLIRIGTIIDIDYNVSVVRVRTGDLETNWLKWSERRAGDTTGWNPPTIGEQVVLLSPGGELSAAILLCSINSDLIPHPSNDKNKTVRQYPDGARVEYDHARGAMTIAGIQTLHVGAGTSITFQTPTIYLDAEQTVSTGQHTVEGLLAYLAGLTGQGGAGGTSISGSFNHSGGNMTSNGVVVHLHVHGGVQSGGSDSGVAK